MPAASPRISSPLRRGEGFVDPKALMAIRSLELRARVVVEGFWNGLHRSPYHGFSVEFTEYRQYTPGDDTRYLDWRLYARSDRYYQENGRSSKLQAPSSREAPSFKFPTGCARNLELGVWNFSGAWCLVLGAFSAVAFSAAQLFAQTNAPASYSSDLTVVHEAQEQALQQARELLAQSENVRDRPALATAIKEMERAQAALAGAKNSPGKLPAALAAEQAAYQALLKVTPREFNMMQSRRGNPGGGQNDSQRRQMDQLEMPKEENRYETERQATAPPNPQQREQLQTADRLKDWRNGSRI